MWVDHLTAPMMELSQRLVHVARYNITDDAWYPLGNNGINNGGVIHELASVGNMLYVGGGVFVSTNDGAVTNLNNIAQYDTLTSTWSAFPKSWCGGFRQPGCSHNRSEWTLSLCWRTVSEHR